ncbi:MAG: isocitrate dehydrogenase [Anaerolineales bacterium]|nr:MAG: isocitrate dehydrogenase [Anaerolineales bacterium]
MSQMDNKTIIVLEGDQTGQELLEQALRVIDPAITHVPLQFEHFDLSLKNRRASNNAVIDQAAAAICGAGLAIKAATITPADPDDVGSPNALLREAIDGKVILRTGRRLPNVRPVGGVHAPISVVRMAVGGAYGAKEWRETSPDGDEVAFRTERISRKNCRAVAEFSFQHAEKNGAKVFGGPKYTVSPLYEGMFKEELDAAAERHPGVRYEPQLIDATYALLLQNAGEALVIPALNRDGDSLSDLVLQMYGSIAGSESIVLGFDSSATEVRTVMAEAPHGTAPALEGKDIANPMAMILAGAALFTYIRTHEADQASRAIYEAAFEAVYQGIATPDMRGQSTTTEFTDEVIRRVAAKLEVWSSLG